MQENDALARFDKMIIAIVGAFFVMLITLVSVNYFSNYIETGVKGYVQGAMIWSKAQKEATYHLTRFVYSPNNSDHQQFKEAMEVIEGDRQAALTLISDKPNHEKARQGLIKGDIPLELIDPMIWLVTNLKNVEYIAQSIEFWKKADTQIRELPDLAERVQDNVNNGSLPPSKQNHFLNRIDEIDKSLMDPVQAYVDVMTQMDRFVNNIAFWVNAVVAVLLMLCGGGIAVGFLYRAKQWNETLAQSEEKLQQFNEKLEQRVEKRTNKLKEANVKLEEKIKERDRLEKNLKSSLKEKEVLLSEIHHRVKNNLAIISGLLQLEVMNCEEDTVVNKVLMQSMLRIHSMAKIHEKLYESESFSNINLKNYISELIDSIFRSLKADKRNIDLTIDCDEVSLNINQALPCALIINELVTNALKYAFEEDGQGELLIKLKQNNSSVTLEISDNGPGLPKDFDKMKKNSLGHRLVNQLVKQLDGNLTVESSKENGTKYKVIFEVTEISGSASNFNKGLVKHSML